MTASTAKVPKKSVFDMLTSIKKAEGDSGALVVAVTDIAPDPNQHRKVFSQENIKNLAAALAEVGVLQPLLVERTGGLPPYMIVDGERRWRAAPLAGLVDLPVYVLEEGGNRSLAQAIANANRKDLSDSETAAMIQALLDESGDPSKKGLRKKIAELLDLQPSEVSQMLAMRDPEWSSLVEEGLIVKADALARFRSCPPDMRSELVAEARAAGEPITVLALKRAKSAAAAEQASAEPALAGSTGKDGTAPAPAKDADQDETVGDASGDGDGQEGGADLVNSKAAVEQPADSVAGDGDRNSHEGGAPGFSGSHSFNDDEGRAAGGYGGDGTGTGTGTGDDDDDDDEDNGSNSSGAGSTRLAGGMSASTSSSTPRGKSASLKLTGELVEVLLRYLVDKSSDRMEVKLPPDLAIAVIENLGGEVPDSADGYSDRIKDLLETKLDGS